MLIMLDHGTGPRHLHIQRLIVHATELPRMEMSTNDVTGSFPDDISPIGQRNDHELRRSQQTAIHRGY